MKHPTTTTETETLTPSTLTIQARRRAETPPPPQDGMDECREDILARPLPLSCGHTASPVPCHSIRLRALTGWAQGLR